MDDESEDSGPGIPEWVVTFGDMMSLLLTFFIMLVSLSEIKEEEKYQALVESFRRRFGHASTAAALSPGEDQPRTTAKAPLATLGRARREDTHRGGVPDKAPVGEEPKVRIIRMGKRTSEGAVVFFAPGSDLLNAEAERVLDGLAEEFGGTQQKIEIRGHVAPETAARLADDSLVMDLAYSRSRGVLRYLTQEKGLAAERFRISTAAANEPMHAGTDVAQMQLNPRVEVFMLDETVDDLRGSPDERAGLVMPGDETAGTQDQGEI